jgi:hypothetical protein
MSPNPAPLSCPRGPAPFETHRAHELPVPRTLSAHRKVSTPYQQCGFPARCSLWATSHGRADRSPPCCAIGGVAAKGFALLERWLGDADMLFLRRDRAEPLVVLPWRVWARLLP